MVARQRGLTDKGARGDNPAARGCYLIEGENRPFPADSRRKLHATPHSAQALYFRMNLTASAMTKSLAPSFRIVTFPVVPELNSNVPSRTQVLLLIS